MKRTVIAYALVISMLLSGCGMGFDRVYVWEQSHAMPDSTESGLSISASSYDQLYLALEQAVESAVGQLTISVAQYDRNKIEPDMELAVENLRIHNPIAAYAIADYQWELGSIGGEQVLAVQFHYIYDQTHIHKITSYYNQTQIKEAIYEALKACDSGLVFRAKNFTEMDYLQLVEDYATRNPQLIMELPQVTVAVYPETGKDRLVELKFIYQTSRDTLRSMQTQVQTVVDAAVDMVSVTAQPRGKYTQIYVLVIDRFSSYTLETSITPAYSLLVYGVGDGRAIATVYAAVCRQAGLECMTVVGTCDGEPRYWNIVMIDGVYYHVDLLRSKQEGQFREMGDSEMEGYVWDYSAYPACGSGQNDAPTVPPEQGSEQPDNGNVQPSE